MLWNYINNRFIYSNIFLKKWERDVYCKYIYEEFMYYLLVFIFDLNFKMYRYVN